MIKAIFILFSIFSFSSADRLVVGNYIRDFALNDQFGDKIAINSNTKAIIFAFEKDLGYQINDFLATKNPTYLANKHTLFVVDISLAPMFVRKMFILSGLKKHNHKVLILDDKTIASNYKVDGDLKKIVVVSIDSFRVEKIDFLTDIKKLESFLNNLKD
ncbi:MAG: hypothetical protein RBS91_08065 [Sulfurimonadaceae bacterium]|jgi:hypothetical protein|nr:hypothetical protein [Sulfurimonadaceae bacterium]